MSNPPAILIVDNNEPFATMLRESLEQNGHYRAAVAFNGDQALKVVADDQFDLAIVDVGLDDPEALGGAAVARELRQRQRTLRLMLIPLNGETVPPELSDLSVQGVLPKPFFLPDLPARIDDALAQPIADAAEPAPAPEAEVDADDEGEATELDAEDEEAPRASSVVQRGNGHLLRERTPQMSQALKALNREISAEAVLLTQGQELIACAGRLASDEVEDLTQAVANSWTTSNRVAKALGREQVRFEQSVDGGEYMFYSLSVAEDVILSAALRADVPLGMIRHQAKQTANDLHDLMDDHAH